MYAGLAQAGATDASAGDLLAALREARADADRAAAEAARVRWWLGAAEDRLRRAAPTHGGVGRQRAALPPGDATAARRFAAAVGRLDVVAIRLAIGGRAIDRWVAGLTCAPEPARTLPLAPGIPAAVLADGLRAAAALAVARARNRPRRLWRHR